MIASLRGNGFVAGLHRSGTFSLRLCQGAHRCYLFATRTACDSSKLARAWQCRHQCGCLQRDLQCDWSTYPQVTHPLGAFRGVKRKHKLGRSRSVRATCTGTFTAFCLVLPAQPSSARSSNALVVNRRTRLGAAIRSRRPCHVD
jgi:hypothetical protein